MKYIYIRSILQCHILVRKTADQDRESQGFIHLQMGTNRFASQSGMTGYFELGAIQLVILCQD
jgi:hypothetical protein